MESLDHLDLSGNRLSSCDSSQLIGLSSGLSRFDLSDNRIDSLDEAAFASLQRLNTLNLNNNAIKTVIIYILWSSITIILSLFVPKKLKKYYFVMLSQFVKSEQGFFIFFKKDSGYNT